MKPILVHCHIYYTDMWPELKQCIQNITPYPFKLYVTMVEEHQAIFDDVNKSFPDAEIEIVENRGYDVWPFVNVINKIDLDDYSYVIKIHTKRYMPIGALLNDFNIEGGKWRIYALEMMSDRKNVRRCIECFDNNAKLGMITNYRLITAAQNDDRNTQDVVAKYLKDRKFEVGSYSFAGGTFFMCRASLLQPLQKLKLKAKDFEYPDAKHKKITLAHILERFFGAIIYAQGYEIKDVYSSNQRNSIIWHWLYQLAHFIYRKKITSKGKIQVKICKIALPISTIKKFLNGLFSIDNVSLNKTKVNLLFIKFSIRHNSSLKSRLELLEKQRIASSKFWDDLWYTRQYNHKFNRVNALDYWYKKGWKKGESPSPYINVKYCKNACEGINPVIAYLDHSLIFFPDNKNNYKSVTDIVKINDYLAYKKKRKAKSVVYTCITNDYDNICELEAYGYINKDWDYVCFTDNAEDIKRKQIGIWEIRPLIYNQSDIARNNRWHKMHPHIIFPEYEESIYIDANINILSNFLFNEITKKHQDFILPRHFKNVCVYQECSDVKKAKLDSEERINQAIDFLHSKDMPQNYGFCENNVLYRRHNNPKIIAIMEEWWDLLEKYAKRDQLYLTYLLWKNGKNIDEITFENTRLLHNDFYVFGHVGKGKKA